MNASSEEVPDRASELERRLQAPVLIAAAAAVPAVFLTGMDGGAGIVGTVLNWVSMVVLTGESVLLFWFSSDRIAWLRSHWWVALVAIVTVPAVLFAIGPVQVLRAARVVTAFQILRVSRLIKVARVLHRHGRRFGRLRDLLWISVLALALVFAGSVLTDPEASSRRVLSFVFDHWMWTAPVAGVLLAVAGGCAVLWWKARRSRGAECGHSRDES
ncbi:hypothetical protein GCM10027563_02450 [Parasphingorhabdus pacifica]